MTHLSERLEIAASVILMLVVVIFNSSAFSQETDKVKSELFREINAEMQSARQKETPVLSPRLFSTAMEFYQRAEVEYKKGERLGNIRKRIAEARTALKKAVEAAGVKKVALAKVLEARRQIAVHEFIRKLATKKFSEAERHFLDAIQKAEKGDIRGARGKSENTLKKYREATLQV